MNEMFEQVFKTKLYLNHRPYAYDVHYRRTIKLCSIKSDASYDPTPIDNAIYICTD